MIIDPCQHITWVPHRSISTYPCRSHHLLPAHPPLFSLFPLSLSLLLAPPLHKIINTTKNNYQNRKKEHNNKMKKEGGPFTGGVTGKVFLCFETKPVVFTLLAGSLVMLIYNLQPYYQNFLSPPCNCSPFTTTTKNLLNTTATTTPLISLSSNPTQKLSLRRARIPKPDPNKREFKPYGNAAALFVQMGAYRGGPNTFAVVGLASKPTHVFGKPWYKCEWVPNNGPAPVRAKATKILPDWGYGRVYTVVVVNCTYPTNPNHDNAGGKLILYAYYSQSPRRFERITALEEAPGTYDETLYSPPYKYDYLYCGSSLYGNLSAARIREWMAYHAWFFGPRSHFVFHDAGGVTPDVQAVLDPWVKLGRATVQDIRDQDQYDGYYYNQFLVVNDCLHRYRFAANWTFFFDVDEYIYLPQWSSSLKDVLDEFKGFTQFTIEQNPMSSKLCLKESEKNVSRQWGFEKLLFRDSRTRIRKDRKYAIQARNALATGVHMSENIVGKSLHKTESKIRYYHYHNSIQVTGEPCREFLPSSAKKTVTMFEKLPYVYDDNMKKLADTIKQFERKTLGTSQLPL